MSLGITRLAITGKQVSKHQQGISGNLMKTLAKIFDFAGSSPPDKSGQAVQSASP